jgi:hypothetical protein
MTHQSQQAGTSGPHHCIATASTITDMIFRYLRARCSAQGGKLSLEELDDASKRFAESVPSGFDLFETIHTRCMRASGSTVASLFTRKTLLTTLLYECGIHSAEASFTHQAAHYGAPWMRFFFQGLANYMREAVCKDADYQLIGSYVRAAKKLKGKMSAAALLKESDVQAVLREGMAPLVANTASPETIEALREMINQHTANTRAAAGSDASKVSQAELQHFLSLMGDEFELALKNASNLQ